ncbi:hypothetical protein PRZ48_007968 [Zasmidium cellare]|uniref:L-serine ammonia-lyase n=1 Tax=Zasmidium cellare TaxID=395010 RepID=A0ABR0EE91_ZASCE|nr:hypothetical protein PRZ48_007968 [Zasmidium cellare]
MIARIKAAGATEVLQHGPSIREADAYMREVVMKRAYERGEEPIYVSPFDHPDIWDGHSTMVDEMREQFEELGEEPPEYVVCSCGGGGLFIGIMQGIEDQGHAWQDVKVLTVNTVGADALPISLEKGENVTLPKITSIATSLGCAKAADRAFELATEGHQTGKVRSVVLSDAEAAMGCWRFAEDERILVEPACGVNVALCYGNRLKKALGRPVRPEDKIVLVICGGSNVSTSMVEDWKQQYGDLDAGKTNGHASNVPSAVMAPNGHC